MMMKLQANRDNSMTEMFRGHDIKEELAGIDRGRRERGREGRGGEEEGGPRGQSGTQQTVSRNPLTWYFVSLNDTLPVSL